MSGPQPVRCKPASCRNTGQHACPPRWRGPALVISGLPMHDAANFNPEPGPVSYFTHRIQLAIEWGHCDPAGIVFNSRFFEFFDSGTWMLFQTALGVPKQQLFEHFGIAGLPLLEAGANFTMPLKFGDVAELESSIGEFRRASLDVRHRILKNGKLAVDGLEKRAWAGGDPKDPSRIHAIAIPADVIERFRIK